MAKVKIEEIIDHLDSEMKKPLEELNPNDTCPKCGDVLSIFVGKGGELLGKCLGVGCGKVYKIKEPTI